MGWSYQNQKLQHETPVDYFKRQFTCSNEKVSSSVLDAAPVRGTVYAAIRNTHHDTGVDYVFCAVILFKNNEKDGFGYKDMCESMGPHEVDCPDRIMKLLSPVDRIPNPSYTADWRARVAAAKTRRKRTRDLLAELKPGCIIRTPRKATFAKAGFTADRFRLKFFRGLMPVFEPADLPGFLCRLPREWLGDATVERSRSVDADAISPRAA